MKGGGHMLKGFKVRLLPTKEQEKILWQSVNGFRWAWNWGLATQMERFENGEKFLSQFDLRKEFRKIRKLPGNEWLTECGANAMCMAFTDLDVAYSRFFKAQKQNKKFCDKTIARAKRLGKNLSSYDKIGHPKFKDKKHTRTAFALQNDSLNVYEKGFSIDKVGKVAYKTDFKFKLGQHAEKFFNPRVAFIGGKWILSFAMEVVNKQYELNDYNMGIDLGVKDLAIVSCNGQKIVYKNNNKSGKVRKLNKKLRRQQRQADRMQKGSNRQKKAYARVGKQMNHLGNIRHDYTHKTTHAIVSMLPKTIVMEDLNVIGLLKNKYLSRAIREQGFSRFRFQVEYKSAERGITVLFANRFYPSSKMCSCCGNVKHDLKLSDRTYKCEVCGVQIDRDFNAARNLEVLAVA